MRLEQSHGEAGAPQQDRRCAAGGAGPDNHDVRMLRFMPGW
jgi:hypothetical protein